MGKITVTQAINKTAVATKNYIDKTPTLTNFSVFMITISLKDNVIATK